MNLGPTEIIIIGGFLLAVPAAFAFATAKVASGKGHPFGLWAVIGFFTGVIGLIIAAVIGPASRPPEPEHLPPRPPG